MPIFLRVGLGVIVYTGLAFGEQVDHCIHKTSFQTNQMSLKLCIPDRLFANYVVVIFAVPRSTTSASREPSIDVTHRVTRIFLSLCVVVMRIALV